MFLVIGPRVDRAEFDTLADKCRALGGWYSRKWGATPGGFAFRDKAKAETFAAEWTPNPTPAGTPEKSPAARLPNLAQKFRDTADKMQPAIDDRFGDRQTNTPKRLAQAEHARLEGKRLERTQKALRALANLYDAGTLPPILANVKTKADVYHLMAPKTEHIANGFHTYSVETGRPYYDTPEALALWALLDSSPADDKAEQLRRKIAGLQFSNIPGYFPTPAALVREMLTRADIQPGDKVLEPEAGHGAIADAARDAGGAVDVYEYNGTLSEILTLKGHNLQGGDFLNAAPAPAYDVVLMNPPFENMQDVDHVRHALKFLKPGGRLVAIVSAGVFSSTRAKAQEFRELLDTLGAEVEDIPAGAFKESGTSVATRLVYARP